jgi:hypothetical protein
MKTKIAEPVAPKFMRPRNYARRVDINWRSIYHYIDKGWIPGYRLQGCLLIDVEEADQIIRSLPAVTTPATQRHRGKRVVK